MLIAALNKHWRPLSYKEFWYEMDKKMTEAALKVADIPKELGNQIWELETGKFALVWDN